LGLKEYILFLEIVYSIILGGAAKLRWAGGGAKRPDGHGNEPKKTGARSARARTRGQNPLVIYTVLFIKVKTCMIKLSFGSSTSIQSIISTMDKS
jgi:hypothetical protein